ncbi:2-oxo acid dehydrogenase subunit E2 [Geodermatophilus sp. SYSU D00684]
MKRGRGGATVLDLPASRRETPNLIDLIWWRHWVYGLVEVDVTTPRALLREYELRSGEQVSFTGYLAYCVGRAVGEDRTVHALRKGRRRLVVLDDVDVLVMVERPVGDVRVPTGHLVRRTDRRPFLEISREIRDVQARPASGTKGMPPLLHRLMLLPGPLARPVGALLRFAARRDPERLAGTGGTVGLSAVGMFGRHSGWALAPNGHTLDLLVGGIARKPVVVGDRIEAREVLSLTVAFDHDVVDGAPAARFVERLVDHVESGAGLPGAPTSPPPAADTDRQAAAQPPSPAGEVAAPAPAEDGPAARRA